MKRPGAETTRMDGQPSEETLGRHSPAELARAVPAPLANHPDYEIVRALGARGTGLVFLARNRLMGRHEVLKILDPDSIESPGVRDRFLREIRAVARLRHPNIVAAYSAFRAGESLVFAMEYAEGHDLARMVTGKGALPPGHACAFIHQAALGLQHAHLAGLVHGDIKPANLILTHKGGRAIIKILDFGLAKAGRHDEPEFIAPEQIGDPQAADIRADIYSLGCTLYYLLSARPPFEGPSPPDVLQAHFSMDAQPLDRICHGLPAELPAIVSKMMAKAPDHRFQTPDEVSKALAPFLKKQSTGRGVVGVGILSATTSVQAPTPTETNEAAAEAGSRDWSDLFEIDQIENDEDDASPEPKWAPRI